MTSVYGILFLQRPDRRALHHAPGPAAGPGPAGGRRAARAQGAPRGDHQGGGAGHPCRSGGWGCGSLPGQESARCPPAGGAGPGLAALLSGGAGLRRRPARRPAQHPAPGQAPGAVGRGALPLRLRPAHRRHPLLAGLRARVRSTLLGGHRAVAGRHHQRPQPDRRARRPGRRHRHPRLYHHGGPGDRLQRPLRRRRRPGAGRRALRIPVLQLQPGADLHGGRRCADGRLPVGGDGGDGVARVRVQRRSDGHRAQPRHPAADPRRADPRHPALDPAPSPRAALALRRRQGPRAPPPARPRLRPAAGRPDPVGSHRSGRRPQPADAPLPGHQGPAGLRLRPAGADPAVPLDRRSPLPTDLGRDPAQAGDGPRPAGGVPQLRRPAAALPRGARLRSLVGAGLSGGRGDGLPPDPPGGPASGTAA